MKSVLFLFIMIATLQAQKLGTVAGVKLDLPLPNMPIDRFIDLSIGHVPKAIIKDGLPFFGAKRGDFKRKPRTHKGYDIYLNHTDVIASAEGYVKEIEKGKLSGTYIKLQHKNKVETLYIHLTSVNVKVGERVKKSQVIGRIDGPAGNAVAAQLHYEIKRNGLHKDPLVYIKKAYSDKTLLEKIARYEMDMQEVVTKRDFLVKHYLKMH